METDRKCSECEGGIDVSPGFTSQEGKVYPETRRKCSTCEGKGVLPCPNFDAIFESVTTTRGAAKGTRRFRKSPPESWKQGNQGLANRRAYYCWRLARFHGGADVTMPMVADLFVGRDAWKPELNAYAEALARKVFGTDLAAAHRWYNALGGNANIKGLPDSAYSGGPVADGNKPGFEREELK
jgi:hypothetical protein